MTGHGLVISVILLVVLAAVPASAQSQDDRITQLEQKLDALLQQASALKEEIQQLRGGAPAEGDLTAVDTVQPIASQTQEPAAAVSLSDVGTVDNQINPAAAKALNPDMSVVGNLIGHGGDNPEGLAPADLSEVELALEAFIDPYAKGKFFLSVGDEGIDVEEGFAQFVTLPWGLTAKAGKTKATFGKANTWHIHQRPWIDQPLMVSRFFGEEGLADTGLSVSKPVDNPWNTYVEATGEVYSGDVENVFARLSDNDLFYNAHLKAFRDITENSNIEVGTSFARGTLASEGARAGHNRFTGVDVTYRWKPLSRSIYNSFIARFEGLANRRAGVEDTLYGYYVSGDYQLGRRWFTGVRLDSADVPNELGARRTTDRGVSATLSFWPSEFSELRGQFRRTRLGIGPSFNEVLLQLQFSIGAHGAHAF
jgi:hypothetical protein